MDETSDTAESTDISWRWIIVLILGLFALAVAVLTVAWAPDLHRAAVRARQPGGTWLGRDWPGWVTAVMWGITAVLGIVHLLALAGAYGYALMASVRRLYWCTHRLRAVRRWRPIAAAAGIGPVRRWAALRAGTNEPTKRSIRRLWAARTPPWLGPGLILIGVGATVGRWVAAGADLTSMPSGLFIFVLVAWIYLSDERAPSVFASRAADGDAKAE